MISDERIRALCARVVTSKGEQFQSALKELQQAIDLRLESVHQAKQATQKA